MQGVHFRKHQIGGLSSVVGSYDFKYLNSLQLKAVTTMCQVYATNESKNFVGQEHFLSFLSGFSQIFLPKDDLLHTHDPASLCSAAASSLLTQHLKLAFCDNFPTKRSEVAFYVHLTMLTRSWTAAGSVCAASHRESRQSVGLAWC